MEEKEYRINHRFRTTEIIVPIIAIEPNFGFIVQKGSRDVITADGVKCIANKVSFENLCDLEEKILSLYRVNAWDFLKRWRSVYPEYLDSLVFATMELIKKE